MAPISLFPVKQVASEVQWHIFIQIKKKNKSFSIQKLRLQSQMVSGCLVHFRSLPSTHALGHTAKNCFHGNRGSFSDPAATQHFFSTSTFNVLHHILLLHTHEDWQWQHHFTRLFFVAQTSSERFHVLPQYSYNILHFDNFIFGRHESEAKIAKILHLINKLEIPECHSPKYLSLLWHPIHAEHRSK